MGGNSSRSATFDLRRKTIGRWTNSFRLQHSKRIHLTLGLASSWWWQKTKEEELHHPKKIKHKHKKVKLSVLKYYRVDDNGKIHRLRRECPAEECGAGIFMAAHFDRQYCGKCGLTYVYNPIEEK